MQNLLRFSTVFVFMLIQAIYCSGQDVDSVKQAYDLARQGLELVDKGKLDEALLVFEKGYALDPENSNFQYEIALVHYLKKEHDQTIKILEKVLNKPDANDQYYQILGNAYDLSGQTAKARKVYAAGIKRFPGSGLLYLELGVLEYMQKNSPEAIRYWESGVIVQPGFSSNYYWLARYYASTVEKVWAVLYGEMFINIERNSERTMEISELVFKQYRTCMSIGPDKKATAGFTKSIAVKPAQGMKLPFEQVFQETMQHSLDSLIRSGSDSLGLEEIIGTRELFLMYWYNEGYAGNYPNIIFEWLFKLPDNSYQESYLRWLFLKGNEEAFQSWYYTHTDQYGAFVNWFKKNPVKVDKNHYFSRSNY